MAREQLVAMTRSLMEHAEAGTIAQAKGVMRVPVSAYTDPELFAREKERLFKRLPLMLAPSCELRVPGNCKAVDVVGMPVLLTRHGDGSIGAYLNMCRHRGNPLAHGKGEASRFTCGYHGWTYRNDGKLVGVAAAGDFGAVDKDALCLIRFPVLERAGLIFAILDPASELDIQSYLCGYEAPPSPSRAA